MNLLHVSRKSGIQVVRYDLKGFRGGSRGGGGGGGGGGQRAKASPPLHPLLKKLILRMRLKLESRSRVMERQCSACSAPMRQCQGVEVYSSNLRYSVVDMHLNAEKIGRETILVTKEAHFFGRLTYPKSSEILTP